MWMGALIFGVTSLPMIASQARTPAPAALPQDEAALRQELLKPKASALEAAHLLHLFNRAEKKDVKAPTAEIEAASAKVRIFYGANWSGALAESLELAEFHQLLLLSYSMRSRFDARYGRKAAYPLEFIETLNQNSNALIASSGGLAAFWIAGAPCLDGGSGELIADLMGQGIRKAPSVWIGALGTAQAVQSRALKSKGGLCGDPSEKFQTVSSVSAFRQVVMLALSRYRDSSTYRTLALELKKKDTIERILKDSGIPASSSEQKAFRAELQELGEFFEKSATEGA